MVPKVAKGELAKVIMSESELFGMTGRVVRIVDKNNEGEPAQHPDYPKYAVAVGKRGQFVFFSWEITRAVT